MKDVLIVIDMQNDFIDGSLGTAEAVAIVPNVVEKIKKYKENDNIIITTQDTHYSDYLQTHEGKELPVPHCIVNTDGWQLQDDIFNEVRNYNKWTNVLKPSFGSIELMEIFKEYEKLYSSQLNITVVGLLLDICVISNVLIIRSAAPSANINVDLSCTVSTNNYLREATAGVLKSCQVKAYG